MKQKLRRLVRQSNADSKSIDQTADDLRNILVLERDRREEIVPIDLGGSSANRTTRQIRRNIAEFKSFSVTRRDYTVDHGDSVIEGSTRTKERLPSLDTHPTRGVGSILAQGNSRSVDRGTANVFSTSNRSYNFNTETSEGDQEDRSKFRQRFREVRALKPNISRLPTLTMQPDNKNSDISKRMMDIIAGRIKKEPRVVRRLKPFSTEKGGVGVFLSDIGFTNTDAEKNKAAEEGIGEVNLFGGGADFMAGLQPFFGLFGQPDGQDPANGAEGVEDIFKMNIDKIMATNNILTGQELKEEQEFIYYIKLLYTDESQKHEFIYAINRKPEMPYNLTPVPFSVIQETQPDYYYTVSKDRVIKHRLNRSVAEDSLMEEWLREKLKFNQLKTLELVRKFRKIKTLKRWKQNIQLFKRKYSAKLIEFKLPILDPMLCKPILEFRQRCIDMENLNYFYISTDKICSVEELRSMQDKTNEYFINQIKQRDRLMNVFIREIVKNFNQLLWDTAFSDLTEDLKGGLKAITCPDPSIYEDDVQIEGKDLAFFHKLMTLNVPYRVKSKIRNICHRLLTMPMFFDSLRFSSLMACYRYNVNRLRDHITQLQEINTDSKSVWQVKRGKANRKEEAYLTVFFELMTDYEPASKAIETLDVVVEKGKTSAVDPLNFDYANNFEDRGFSLADVSQFDMSKIDDSTNISDLHTLLNKSYMYDRGIPYTMQLQKIAKPSSVLVSIKPSFSELKDFLLKEYDDFVNVLSSFKKCAVSGEFNLYFKLMIHWASEDLRPEDDNELLDLSLIIDDRDRRQFERQVIDPIEVDYNNVKSVSKELAEVALQHWRNSRADITGNQG